MIAISTLEEIELRKGQVYCIVHNQQPLILGVEKFTPDPLSNLSILGTLAQDNSILQLSVVKQEPARNPNKPIPKKYRLLQNGLEVKQVQTRKINQILSEYIVLNISGITELSQELVGYKYSSQLYEKDEETQLFQQIQNQYALNLSNLEKLIPQSHEVIKPLQYTILVISKLKSPTRNQFVSAKFAPQVRSVKVLVKIGNQKHLNDVLTTTVFKLMASDYRQQQTVQFLQYLLEDIPEKIWNPNMCLVSPSFYLYSRHLFKGYYEFYHYGDQSFADHGWGCAYRACQSLLSWFDLSTNRNVKVPTIEAIQRKLFQIDKSRNLVKTSQWIGANQVGWLVSNYLDIDCKIVFLQDGENIMDKAEVFKHHFETQGTPIMYGGGQYAYTILGINYSWKLNQCQFLILDPHYSQDDKYKTILEQEGVSWKDKSKLFKKGVYYNFCLPQVRSQQRPSGVVGRDSEPNQKQQ